MKTARKPSVAVVVATMLVTVTTLLLATFGAVSYLSRRSEEWSRLRRSLSAEADELAVSLALPAWNIDRAQIDRIIESLGETPAVEAVFVTVAGRVHARVRDAEWRLVPSEEEARPRTGIVEERIIRFSGEPIGTIRLVASARFVEADLRQSLLWLAGTILTTDVLLVLGVYLVLWRVVLRPLLAIEQYAVAVSDQGRSSATPAKATFTAELESLRASIETMIRLLDLRYAELQEQMVRRLELQESLRQSEKMSAMGSLVAGVAHEVRTPLFGLSATLDAYEDELNRADLLECAAALRLQVARLTHLMAELLEFGKPATVTTVPGSLHELIHDVLAGRAAAASKAAIVLRNSVPTTDSRVLMDRERLRQVFENLVDNALQHSPPGGSVTVSATPRPQGEEVWIECHVDDEGAGFAYADLTRAFEPFFTRRKGGTGLGLSIVQRIVEQHSGLVTASNRPEGGARVTVRLPGAEPL
jgi:signal transduction histidine kinase